MNIANEPEPPPGPEPLIEKPEVAKRVDKTARTVDAWMASGLIPYYKLPGGRRGTVLFKWTDVLAALEKFRVN